jgi:peptide/nickel transport system substrate-binding protein
MLLNRRQILIGSGSLGLVMSGGLTRAAPSTRPLRLRTGGDIAVIDPAFDSGQVEEEVARAIYVSLIRLDDFRQPIAWSLYAADMFERADPLSIRFRLRRDLFWSDGFGQVTAEDVKYSFERIADPAQGSPWAYLLEALDHVEVTDEFSGILRLNKPSQPIVASSLTWYSGYIVCKQAMEKAGGRYTTEPPATCGPYRIEDWQPKQTLTLVANPDWRGDKPAYPRIVISVIPDEEVAALAYQSGAIDFTRVTIKTLSLLRREPLPNTTMIAQAETRLICLSLNMRHPVLKDIRVRQAIQYAVDVDQIIKGAYGGIGERATGVVPPTMIGCRKKNLIEKPDLARARKLLAEAGAKSLEIDIHVINETVSMTVAQIVQAHLEDIGITLHIRSYDDGTFWTLGVKELNEHWESLDMILTNISGGVDPADNVAWFTRDQIGSQNWSLWSNEEFDRLYNEAIIEPDTAVRDRLYQRMQDIMELSGGFIFLSNGLYTAVHRADLNPVILPDSFMDFARTRPVDKV